MTLNDRARSATEPAPEQLARVRSRVISTLAEEPRRAVALRDLPDVDASALARVRRRLASTLSDVRPGSRLLWVAALSAAALVVALRAALPSSSGGTPPPELTQALEAPAVQRQVSPSPAPVIAEVTAAPVSPGPSSPAPSVASVVPSPSPLVASTRRPIIGAVQTYGQLDRDRVDRALAAAEVELARCVAGVSEPVKVSVSIDVEGKAKAIVAVGEGSDCVRSLLMATRFGPSAGLRAGPLDQVTGGVLKFELGSKKP